MMTMRTFSWVVASSLVLMNAALAQDAQKCAGLISATATMVPGSTTVIRSAVLNAAKPGQAQHVRRAGRSRQKNRSQHRLLRL